MLLQLFLPSIFPLLSRVLVSHFLCLQKLFREIPCSGALSVLQFLQAFVVLLVAAQGESQSHSIHHPALKQQLLYLHFLLAALLRTGLQEAVLARAGGGDHLSCPFRKQERWEGKSGSQ